MTGSVVAIVGRPNVGKSTLFNRLTATRTAIEEKTAGVTRDRLYGLCEWRGRTFIVIDTGGINPEKTDEMSVLISRQAALAVEEADIIIFVLDARDGLMPLDEEIAGQLRRSGKTIIPVVNKVDTPGGENDVYPFYRLGLDEPRAISAAHGRGVGDLLDLVVDALPEETGELYPAEAIKVAVIGRPNVGKSSLVNALLGEERVIVSETPGTTREAVDTWFTYGGRSYVLIDTAGVRRKSKIKETVEYYSVLRSLKAVERADLSLLLLDGTAGVAEQDVKLAGHVDEAGCGLVVAVNKWDLAARAANAAQRFQEDIRRHLVFAAYAPVVFISALTGQGVAKLFPLIDQTWSEVYKRISTPLLNELVADAVAVNPPPTVKGRRLKIYYATQPQCRPPTFVLFVNDPQLMHFSYLRYLENRLRESFGFKGTPVRIKVRRRKGKRE